MIEGIQQIIAPTGERPFLLLEDDNSLWYTVSPYSKRGYLICVVNSDATRFHWYASSAGGVTKHLGVETTPEPWGDATDVVWVHPFDAELYGRLMLAAEVTFAEAEVAS